MTTKDAKYKNLILLRSSHILVWDYFSRYDKKSFQALRSRLSRWEKVGPISKINYTAMLIDTGPDGSEVLRLPGNVPMQVLKEIWPSHRIMVQSTSWPAREIEAEFLINEFPPNSDEQRRIMHYLSSDNGVNGTWLVAVKTAGGKSYASIHSWIMDGTVLLGTFAQKVHLENYLAEILKFTTVTMDEILIIDDGRNTVNKVLANIEKYKHVKAVLAIHRTIHICAQNNITHHDDNESISEINGVSDFVKMVHALGVGFHVSDECQLELVSLVTFGMMTNIKKTVYLSATPERSQWDQDRILSMQLPLDHALVIESAPRLEVQMVRMNSKPSFQDQAIMIDRRGYFNVVRYFDHIMEDDDRYNNWLSIITQLIDEAIALGTNGVGLVVSGRLEFLDKVIDSLSEIYPDKTIGNFSSRIKKIEERMKALECDIVVTTEKSFNGSVNPLRMSDLILCGTQTSKPMVEQIAGRLRGIDGNACRLVDLTDIGYDKLSEYYNNRRRIYRKIAKTVKEKDFVHAVATAD